MARSWRIEYQGALYHVLSRGNERRNIFVDDQDRLLFLNTLGEMADRFEIDIFAYVLMDNHYHLLLRTKRANLSKSLQWFGATYTKRFNISHFRTGHLFQGRFKNMLVQNNAYVMQLSCYIHRNPLRAGMVNRLVDFKWSSYQAYAYGKGKPSWLNTETILSQLNAENRHRAYREKVQKYSKEEQRIWENFRHGLFLGTKQFAERMKKSYLQDEPHREMPQQKQIRKALDPEAIIAKAAGVIGCDINRFRQSARIFEVDKKTRDMLIYLIWQTGVSTNQEIGDIFGLTYSAVSQRASIFKSLMQKDKALRKSFNQLKSQMKI